MRNIASNWVHMVWGVIWGLTMTPIFIKTLGKGDYGVWILINGIIGYYGLLDLGVRSAVIRFVSRSLALKDRGTINETVNTGFVLYSGIGAVAVIASIVFALVLPNIKGFAVGEYPNAAALIVLVGITMAISFPGRLLEGVLSAAERFDVSNILRIVFSLLRNVSFIVLLYSGYGLLAMAWAILVVTAVEKVVVAVVVLKKVPGTRLDPRLARRSRVPEILNYGLFAFLAGTGERFRPLVHSVVIGAVMPAQAITIFNIGVRPLEYLSRLTMGIARVLTPAFSRTEAKGGKEGLQKLLILGTRGTSVMTALACLIFASVGDRLLRLWVGAGFSESAAIMLILIPAYLFANIMHPTGSILYGTSRHKILSVLSFAEGAAILGLTLWWIHPLGLAGVALATAGPMLLTRLFVIPIYSCRTVDLPYGAFLSRALGPTVPAVVVTGLLSLGLRRWIPGDDLPSVLAVMAIMVIVYAVTAFLTLLLRSDELLPARYRMPETAPAGVSPALPRVFLIAYRFPPQGGGGVQRPAKLVKHWSRAGAAVAVMRASQSLASLRDPTLLDDIPGNVARVPVPDPGLPVFLGKLRSRKPGLLANPLTRGLLIGLLRIANALSVPDASAGWLLPALVQGWRTCRTFRPDVMAVSGPPWTPVVAATILSKLTGVPLVLDYRDPWNRCYLSTPMPWLARRVGPFLERAALRRAAGVVAAHRAVFRELGAWVPASTPRLWAPNGYDPDDFAGAPLQEDDLRFTLTYTGGFFSWRSPRVLFEVLDELLRGGEIDPDRFRLVLAGRVDPALRHCPEGGPLSRALETPGYLPHREGIGLLRRSTVNLVLEGDPPRGGNRHTPGKFYEVAYAGRPVLLLCPEGTTTALARRIGGCRIAHPEDRQAIRSAVTDLYGTWKAGETPAGPKRSELHFYDRSVQADRFLAFLSRTVSPDGVSRPTGVRAAVLS